MPSSLIIFVRQCKGKNINHVDLYKKFKLNVSKEDYEVSERDEILAWIESSVLISGKGHAKNMAQPRHAC